MEQDELEYIASEAYRELLEVKMSLYAVMRLLRLALVNQGMSEQEIQQLLEEVAVEAKAFVDQQQTRQKN